MPDQVGHDKRGQTVDPNRVILGLDTGIQAMDCPVKPGNDKTGVILGLDPRIHNAGACIQ